MSSSVHSHPDSGAYRAWSYRRSAAARPDAWLLERYRNVVNAMGPRA